MVIRPSASGRNWNALSDSYRQRLERAGVSRREYERGVSLSSARGHATTPERPSQASPERHSDYFNRRERLINSIQSMKRELYGTKEAFNSKRSREAIDKNPKTGRSRSIKELERAERKIAAMVDGEDYEEFYDEPEDYDDDWLYYH